jgi:hypothetical protein
MRFFIPYSPFTRVKFLNDAPELRPQIRCRILIVGSPGSECRWYAGTPVLAIQADSTLPYLTPALAGKLRFPKTPAEMLLWMAKQRGGACRGASPFEYNDAPVAVLREDLWRNRPTKNSKRVWKS